MAIESKPRLIPTGKCWCGCGKDVGLGKFFAVGHDKIAEAALMALNYDGPVAQFGVHNVHACKSPDDQPPRGRPRPAPGWSGLFHAEGRD
ncbi:hypothetical protein [Streptomyces sp. NPDC058412]|uniref:hypothetical protein n=1 Tax=Streptomyces sp. NPDC058412 TaxID=3346486 RepID=UPI00364DA576